ncbi:hypothetical protein L1887_62985 [Cichorium endivia]|nr:hypothetical protein L1887_62985 [Cichorium endivia]
MLRFGCRSGELGEAVGERVGTEEGGGEHAALDAGEGAVAGGEDDGLGAVGGGGERVDAQPRVEERVFRGAGVGFHGAGDECADGRDVHEHPDRDHADVGDDVGDDAVGQEDAFLVGEGGAVGRGGGVVLEEAPGARDGARVVDGKGVLRTPTCGAARTSARGWRNRDYAAWRWARASRRARRTSAAFRMPWKPRWRARNVLAAELPGLLGGEEGGEVKGERVEADAVGDDDAFGLGVRVELTDAVRVEARLAGEVDVVRRGLEACAHDAHRVEGAVRTDDVDKHARLRGHGSKRVVLGRLGLDHAHRVGQVERLFQRRKARGGATSHGPGALLRMREEVLAHELARKARGAEYNHIVLFGHVDETPDEGQGGESVGRVG